MLETVRSRRIYGAAITIVLPLCAALGYSLRSSHDDQLVSTTSALLDCTRDADRGHPTSLTPAQDVAIWKEQAAIEERVRLLRRHEHLLQVEADELREKLNRAHDRGSGSSSASPSWSSSSSSSSSSKAV